MMQYKVPLVYRTITWFLYHSKKNLQGTKRDLLHGFVECLEAENLEDVEASQDDGNILTTEVQILKTVLTVHIAM